MTKIAFSYSGVDKNKNNLWMNLIFKVILLFTKLAEIF